MTLKDSIDTAGVVTTWGTTGRRGFVPRQDATAAARLRAAGAVLLGKTNTPELTMAFETDNSVYGRTSNPWDPARTCGGSSGGAAAIVAAGGAPFDLGSDTGGSIRLPSHFCGVLGLKPTSGRVSRAGHAVPFGGLLDLLTVLGPLARSVDDLERVHAVVAGPDGRDPALVPAPLLDSSALALEGLSVRFHVSNDIATPTAETAEAVRGAARALEGARVRVEEERPPGIEETQALYFDVIAADRGLGFRRILAAAGTREPHPGFARFLTALEAIPADARRIPDTIERWDRFRERMTAFLSDCNAILCPVNATPAKPHGASDGAIGDFTYTMTYNLLGWPAVVVPAGRSPEGLPIGVQIVARPFREDVALALARRLEAALGGFVAPGG
jgi:amidase